MSYTRYLESRNYIWPDDKGVNFNNVFINNDTLDIFLYKIYTNRQQEFLDRINHGKQLIDNYKIDGDMND